jgi:hypothetical protein
MSARSLGGLVAVMALFSLCATAARGDDTCWRLLYAAVQHNAAVPHAPFVSYSESVDLQEDGNSIQSARANVTYRDDGVAYVDDSRFDHPFVSFVLDPGPPVLGPYGGRRQTWLDFGTRDATLPIIADTQTAHAAECKDLGDDTIEGGKFAHLVFPEARGDVPDLKSVWIDRARLTVRRAVMSEYINFYFYDGDITQHLADFTLEVSQIDGHDVLDQVNWHYSYWQYGQRTTLKEEYKFGAYQFNAQAPAGTQFATAGGSSF